MRLCFVSSFPPRKCGLATYTKDLAIALKKQNVQVSIIAMQDDIPQEYGSYVVKKIRQENLDDYLDIAEYINKSSIDIVHLQHEFGLFGGENGEYILAFINALKKPVVTTFHTVLTTPSEKQKYIIQELTRLSRKVIVMQEIAKERLEKFYNLNPWDIQIIYHGVPELSKLSYKKAKQKLGLKDSFTLLSSNLLSSNKGIEYAIQAIADVKKIIPNILFLIVGETHPNIIKNEGEVYRRKLEQLVQQLGIENNVRFINKYVSLRCLTEFLAAADIYITPYLDPEQITSGTLSYAIGAGKACIATEYIYAQKILAKNKGLLVPFKDSDAIAKALITLKKDPRKKKQIEKNAWELGKKMRWPTVAKEHKFTYKNIVKSKENIEKEMRQFLQQPIDISHINRLMDDTGIVQHAFFSNPDLRFGYSTDDIARCLIVLVKHYQKEKNITTFSHLERCISFLEYSQVENGLFHNFLNKKKKWIDVEDINDTFGRTMWGLGLYIYTDGFSSLSQRVRRILMHNMHHVEKVRDLRAAAYVGMGMYYSVLSGKKRLGYIANSKLIAIAEFLIAAYEQHASDDWQWFEDEMTYDSFRLPQVLFAGYLITKNIKYKIIAEESLNFLTKISFNAQESYFDFIGQNGWFGRNKKRALFDQQPLDASGAIGAYVFAHQVTKKRIYKKYAQIAFSWFFGNNRNHRSLYHRETKGVFDGLTPRGVNMNEGAESIISFLIACNNLQTMLYGKIITADLKHPVLEQSPKLSPHQQLRNKQSTGHLFLSRHK